MDALQRGWAWYMARGLVMKLVIALVAIVLVVTPFTGGEDPEAASAESATAETPTATVTATATTTVTATPEPDEETTETVASETEPSKPEPVQTEVATPSPKATKPAKRTPRTYLVSRVVDGDTIELGNGETVRVVGIDTPERGECGYGEATANMERLVLGKRVGLGQSDEDRDHYGRLLRYTDVGQVDAGLRQIKAGLAIARYDSRDGYGYHPREDRYIAADNNAPDVTCSQPEPAPAPTQKSGGGSSGSVYYENCTAARAAGAAPVRRGDPGYGSHLDRDGDGVGCE
jgi:endonuclease YncB( thermonuclease family)